MKRIVFFTIGLLPLPLGYLLAYLALADQLLPLVLIGLGVLAFWFLVGVVSANFFRTREGAMLFLNLPALLVLILILIQSLVLQAFWPNPIGIATQYFYLPFLGISRFLGFFFTLSLHVSAIFAFICMLITSFVGRLVGEQIY